MKGTEKVQSMRRRYVQGNAISWIERWRICGRSLLFHREKRIRSRNKCREYNELEIKYSLDILLEMQSLSGEFSVSSASTIDRFRFAQKLSGSQLFCD